MKNVCCDKVEQRSSHGDSAVGWLLEAYKLEKGVCGLSPTFIPINAVTSVRIISLVITRHFDKHRVRLRVSLQCDHTSALTTFTMFAGKT